MIKRGVYAAAAAAGLAVAAALTAEHHGLIRHTPTRLLAGVLGLVGGGSLLFTAEARADESEAFALAAPLAWLGVPGVPLDPAERRAGVRQWRWLGVAAGVLAGGVAGLVGWGG